MSRYGLELYESMVGSSGRHLQTPSSPGSVHFYSGNRKSQRLFSRFPHSAPASAHRSCTKNRKYPIISKTSRWEFSCRSLVLKIQLSGGFYSVLVVFGLLRVWLPLEHMGAFEHQPCSRLVAHTSALEDKTGPRSIGARNMELGVHFYSLCISDNPKTRVFIFNEVIQKICTVTFSKTIMICSHNVPTKSETMWIMPVLPLFRERTQSCILIEVIFKMELTRGATMRRL